MVANRAPLQCFPQESRKAALKMAAAQWLTSAAMNLYYGQVRRGTWLRMQRVDGSCSAGWQHHAMEPCPCLLTHPHVAPRTTAAGSAQERTERKEAAWSNAALGAVIGGLCLWAACKSGKQA